MLQFLMDNSITILFLVTATIVGRNEYRRYLQRKGISSEEFRVSFREKINEVGRSLLPKLATSVVLAAIISIVSFRELFINDIFHTVFLTMLLANKTNSYIQKLFE